MGEVKTVFTLLGPNSWTLSNWTPKKKRFYKFQFPRRLLTMSKIDRGQCRKTQKTHTGLYHRMKYRLYTSELYS